MSYAADPIRREAILDAEQRRLDWLREHPDVPVMEFDEKVYVGSRAEVTAIAMQSGVKREELAAGCRAIVPFGAGVSYVAVATEAKAAAA